MTSVLLVTGGSRGIGAAVARLAAAEGYRVALTYQGNREAAEAVLADVEAAGSQAMLVQADVAVESQVLTAFAAVDTAFGRLDVVVNNAGVLGPVARVDEMTVERLTWVVSTNVIGAFLVAREAIKRLSTRHGGPGGAIVNVSSAAARLGSPNEFVDYAATKGALDTMTLGLAREVTGEGIRVNAVRPGLIETDIHASAGAPDRVERLAGGVPIGRGGSAEEVARTILWLASPAASYVSGALLDVAGGR